MPQVSILNVLINQDLQELIKQKKREEEEERSRKMLQNAQLSVSEEEEEEDEEDLDSESTLGKRGRPSFNDQEDDFSDDFDGVEDYNAGPKKLTKRQKSRLDGVRKLLYL